MLMFLYKIISYFEPKLLMTWLFQYSSFIFMWINIHESNFVLIHFRKYHFKVLIVLIILNLDFSSPIHFFLTWNFKKFSLSFKYIRKKCDENSWLNYFWSIGTSYSLKGNWKSWIDFKLLWENHLIVLNDDGAWRKRKSFSRGLSCLQTELR